MQKELRVEYLTKGLGQMLKPEQDRLRKELESGTQPLLTGRVQDEYGQC